MLNYHTTPSGTLFAELITDNVAICSADDILDIMAEAGMNDCSRLIISSGALSESFFVLGSGLAGEILQKISNYRMRLAIVGDFTNLTSKSWKDFIRESNRSRRVIFAPSVVEAIELLR